jgi:putative ABC transport system permease protein
VVRGLRPIHRKLLREIAHLRGQMISIALVVTGGIMTVVAMRGTYQSLLHARDRYYTEYRFADIWASLKRAPESVARAIADIPGVAAVETRVTFTAQLHVPGLEAPGLGRFVSLPPDGTAILNRIHLTSGRLFADGHRDEVILSRNFAEENGLEPGDSLAAVINGSLRTLQVAGTAISPEYTYAVPPGGIYPDNQRYGILWINRDVIGPAYDMDGAFNEVSITLAPAADDVVVMAQLDRILEPWGGLGAYTRERQISHRFVSDELAQDRTTSTVIPGIFLAVAAFLLNLVLGRLIATQRTEIGILKAFGYDNATIGWHYLGFAVAPVLAGAIVGSLIGIWVGHGMILLYRDFFDFPDLHYEASVSLVLIAASVSLAAACIGAVAGVRRAVRLPPAEAMRPEPPARFKHGVTDRSPIGRMLPAAWRMILRNVERQPLRSVMAATGVGFSVGILVIGMFMYDGAEYMMDLQFRLAQREDLSVSFNEPLERRVRWELASLPGVTEVEPYRHLAVRLHSGHREREVGIIGIQAGSRLRRIIAANGDVQPLPPEGLILSKILADMLDVHAGDEVDVEVLEGARPRRVVRVTGVVEDFLGMTGYMNLDAVHRLAGDGNVVSGAWLEVQADYRSSLNARMKTLPAVASVASPDDMLASFQGQLEDSLYIAVAFLLVFAGVIAVAVIYNGARIALSERGRELASLRVLGFSRPEVATLLFGEQAIVTFLGIPLGWLIGYLLSLGLVNSLQSESYRIPVVVNVRTYAWTAIVAAIAAIVSALLVRRRLNRLDLIAVLKTRE